MTCKMGIRCMVKNFFFLSLHTQKLFRLDQRRGKEFQSNNTKENLQHLTAAPSPLLLSILFSRTFFTYSYCFCLLNYFSQISMQVFCFTHLVQWPLTLSCTFPDHLLPSYSQPVLTECLAITFLLWRGCYFLCVTNECNQR